MVAAPSWLNATPYPSNVQLTGTTVNFILNEPADTLTYSINGGAAVALDGTTKGAKTFTLGAPTDTFSIIAEKDAAIGFTIPTGVVLPAENSAVVGEPSNGLTQPTNEGGFNVISDETNILTRFNSPRGLDINRNPNTPNFGTSYIANSAAGTQVASNRTLGDGLYAIRADQSDAFGYLDTAQNPLNEVDGFAAFSGASGSSPFRIFVKDDGDLYVADYSDVNGQLFKINPTLTTARNIFEGFGGPAPPDPPTNPDGTGLPAGQNHGSISSVHVEGSLATNDLVVYAMDEDLNSAHFTTGAIQNDRNSLWRWNVGGTTPSNVTPTKIAGGLIGDFPAGGITVDMARGADGKFYMTQARSTTTAANPGILVADETGTILFNSLTESRELVGDPAARDILTWTMGMAISPDQQWLAIMVNSSDVAVIPLIDGIPDLANRLLVNSGAPTGENSGRDIAFDAAGNIHYVSSGQGRYRVLAPGGHTIATMSWNGSAFSFDVETAAAPGVPGDYNNNGTVDAADYVLWRNGGPLQNEVDAPGTVNQADYDAWRARFGNTSGSGSGSSLASVPEPATLAMSLLGLMLAGARCRRRP